MPDQPLLTGEIAFAPTIREFRMVRRVQAMEEWRPTATAATRKDYLQVGYAEARIQSERKKS